ncbi:hypothetical protein D3C85_1433760 [compost metagenome]
MPSMDEGYRIVAVNRRDADPVCAEHRMDHHKETVLLASIPSLEEEAVASDRYSTLSVTVAGRRA